MRLYLFGAIPLELHIFNMTKDYDSLVNKSVQERIDEGLQIGIGNNTSGPKGSLYT